METISSFIFLFFEGCWAHKRDAADPRGVRRHLRPPLQAAPEGRIQAGQSVSRSVSLSLMETIWSSSVCWIGSGLEKSPIRIIGKWPLEYRTGTSPSLGNFVNAHWISWEQIQWGTCCPGRISWDNITLGHSNSWFFSCPQILEKLYIKDLRTGGEGGWSKSRHSNGGCVDLVLWINPKFGQGGGGGPKSRKFCGRPLCMAPNINCWDLLVSINVRICSCYLPI